MAVQVKILAVQVLELLTYFSGAVGKCTDTRSFQKNRKIAFERLVESKTFLAWHKLECARRQGNLAYIEALDKDIEFIKAKIKELEEWNQEGLPSWVNIIFV